jgi:hypothetical protein
MLKTLLLSQGVAVLSQLTEFCLQVLILGLDLCKLLGVIIAETVFLLEIFYLALKSRYLTGGVVVA